MALLSIFATLLIAMLIFSADGTSDAYYHRFTTPRQHALIIGTSRAAQGIHPQYFSPIFSKGALQGPLYNYAFTALQSPYGSAYLKAIKEKIHPETRKGLFLLSVTPWSVSRLKSCAAPDNLRESKSFIGQLSCYSCNPNLSYLRTYFNDNFGSILLNRIIPPKMAVQSDGWLQLRVPMDDVSVAARTKTKITDYRYNQLPKYIASPYRLAALEQTIQYLKTRGNVFLVRVPIPEPLLAIEMQLMPDFDKKMHLLSEKYNLQYFNYVQEGENYEYVDGNHLSETSGALFSSQLADEIVQHYETGAFDF